MVQLVRSISGPRDRCQVIDKRELLSVKILRGSSAMAANLNNKSYNMGVEVMLEFRVLSLPFTSLYLDTDEHNG